MSARTKKNHTSTPLIQTKLFSAEGPRRTRANLLHQNIQNFAAAAEELNFSNEQLTSISAMNETIGRISEAVLARVKGTTQRCWEKGNGRSTPTLVYVQTILLTLWKQENGSTRKKKQLFAS